MGSYYNHIGPHLFNLAMRNRLLKAYRELRPKSNLLAAAMVEATEWIS